MPTGIRPDKSGALWKMKHVPGCEWFDGECDCGANAINALIEVQAKQIKALEELGAAALSPPMSNAHLYFSASTQAEVDEAVPILLQIAVAVRGLSLEPLLEPIEALQYLDLRQKCVGTKGCGYTGASVEFDNPKKAGAFRCPQCGKDHSYLITDSLDHIIVGCESGPKARPCKLEWVRSIIGQCREAGVPCYVKQIPVNGKASTNPEDWPEDVRIREMPKCQS